MKLLLFDLDATLLRSDKTISQRTMKALAKCREQGILIGVSTSRAIHNCMTILPVLEPDVVIASAGAVVQFRGEYIYAGEYTEEESRAMIAHARRICGADCEITIDTLKAHYWNYKVNPAIDDFTWGEPVHTDYRDFYDKAVKMCVEIFEPSQAEQLAASLPDCDCLRFAGCAWHKFTKRESTKENAIKKVCAAGNIDLRDITAFGDDTPDIGMLTLCGTGIAMGNALDTVKAAADLVIGSNDEDGIAVYLENNVL